MTIPPPNFTHASPAISSNSIHQPNQSNHQSSSSTTTVLQPQLTTQKDKNLKILQLNINGIKNKITELRHFLNEEDIDVAVIQETKLHPSSKTPSIPNYSFTRQDRQISNLNKSKTIGGGLITYIKQNIPYTKTASYTLPDIESQTITLPLTQSKNLIITNLYIPQRNPTTNLQTEDANISTFFNRLTNIPNSLIAGDINAHSQLWHSPTPDHRGDVITSLLQGSDHVVLNQNTYNIHTHAFANLTATNLSRYHLHLFKSCQSNLLENHNLSVVRSLANHHHHQHQK